MKKRFLILLLLLSSLALYSQAPTSCHLLRLGAGLGYEDGLIFTTRAPVMSLGYEYQLNRRWALGVNLTSFYRAHGGVRVLWFQGTTNITPPVLDYFARDADSPLFNEAEQVLADKGMVPLSTPILKVLTVPLDLGMTFFPIAGKRHRAGVHVAANLTFQSINTFRNGGSQPLLLPDSEKEEVLTMFRRNEIRSISPGFSARLLYEYHFPRTAIGIRAGNTNYWFASTQTDLFWDTALYLAIKL